MTGCSLRIALLGIALALVFGCAYQTPIYESEDLVVLDVRPHQMILQGPAMASSRRFHILFFRSGSWHSFVEVERGAIQSSGSELLVTRFRLKQFQGFLIPALWLQGLGFEGATDIPIIGWEVYTVAGTGVRLVPERRSSEDRSQAEPEDEDVAPTRSQ